MPGQVQFWHTGSGPVVLFRNFGAGNKVAFSPDCCCVGGCPPISYVYGGGCDNYIDFALRDLDVSPAHPGVGGAGFVVANEGKLLIHDIVSAGVSVRLFQNDYTPLQDDVEADYTVATFGGYAHQAMGWGAPALDGAGRSVVTGGPVTFTKNVNPPNNDIYGIYFLLSLPVAPVGNHPIAERFPGGLIPAVVPAPFDCAGDNISASFAWTLEQDSIAAPLYDMVFSDGAELDCLNSIPRSLAGEPNLAYWRAGLFKADINPADTDTVATYTAAGVEADFPGYARQTMWSHNQTAATVGGKAEKDSNYTPRWTRASNSGAQDIYGYFVYEKMGIAPFTETLIGAERYTGAITLTSGGDYIDHGMTGWWWDANQ